LIKSKGIYVETRRSFGLNALMLSKEKKMAITNTNLILGAVVLLVIGIFLGIAFSRLQRTKRLQERFGPEYDRTVSEIGDKRRAEHELEARLDHVKSLEIHPLSAEEINRFTQEWQNTQAEFVDEPLAALKKADRLIREAMNAKGYPVNDFEQRAADISVDYPDLVVDYRGLHAIAVKSDDDEVSTEEMRQAMIHGRALFENLMKPEVKAEEMNQKEPV
jgi:hypothetical protein